MSDTRIIPTPMRGALGHVPSPTAASSSKRKRGSTVAVGTHGCEREELTARQDVESRGARPIASLGG